MRLRLRPVLPLLSSGALVLSMLSCTGGRTPQPPVFQRTVPGATAACVAGPFQIVFDRAVALRTDADTVLEVDGAPVARTVGLSADGARVLLTPAVPVHPGSVVHAILRGLSDPEGGRPVNDVDVSWTLGTVCVLDDALAVARWGSDPSVALLPDGTAVVAWAEASNVPEPAQVAAFTPGKPPRQRAIAGGGSVSAGRLGDAPWLAFGSFVDNRGYAGPLVAGSLAPALLPLPFDTDPLSRTGYPALAFDGDAAVVAFVEDFQQTLTSVHVVRWNGSAWVELAASTATQLSYADPAVLAAGGGSIFLAWTEYAPPLTHVARWNGGAWATLGSGLRGNAMAIAADAAGVPYVAALNEVFVWEGAAWRSLGDVRVDPYGYRTSTALAIDGDGHPVVAWSEAAAPDGPWAVFVRRWTGTAWTGPIGPVASTQVGREVGHVALAVDGTSAVVAWDDRKSDGTTSQVGVARLNL